MLCAAWYIFQPFLYLCTPVVEKTLIIMILPKILAFGDFFETALLVSHCN